MSKARDMAEIISTPPSIYSTDAEVAATYLTQSSASTIYKGSNFRNLIINGDMQIAQRATSVASITVGGYHTVDRWNFGGDSLGTWTMSVENDAPTGSGFRKSAKVLCTTADASPAAGDYIVFLQRFEGQNLQQIFKGTSSAKELTLSFWVKANVTGTYIAELSDIDNTRTVSKSYTVSASATWEKKTITFPADTTGAFDNDNALSLQLNFWLGAGSTFTGGSPLQTSWGTTTNTRVTGQTNLASATNNYWQITGVQLEVGSTATEFEFLPAQVELALCQRYYEKSFPYATAPQNGPNSTSFVTTLGVLGYVSGNSMQVGFLKFTVQKRIAPTMTAYGNSSGQTKYRDSITSSTDLWSVSALQFYAISESGVTLYQNVVNNVVVPVQGHWVADAEL